MCVMHSQSCRLRIRREDPRRHIVRSRSKDIGVVRAPSAHVRSSPDHAWTYCSFRTPISCPRTSPTTPREFRTSTIRTTPSFPAVASTESRYLFQSQWIVSPSCPGISMLGRELGLRRSHTFRWPSVAVVASWLGECGEKMAELRGWDLDDA